jgi:hypothetical protein
MGWSCPAGTTAPGVTTRASVPGSPQLYQDHEPVDEEDTPHVWLSGIDFTYHTKDQLAAGIAEATGLRVHKIRKAMAASEPFPVG